MIFKKGVLVIGILIAVLLVAIVSASNETHTFTIPFVLNDTNETVINETIEEIVNISEDNNTFTIPIEFESLEISDVNLDINENMVIASWITNLVSDSTVNYGLTKDLGQSSVSNSFETEHYIGLIGLNSGTTYYYQITSCDEEGNCLSADIDCFTTLGELEEIIIEEPVVEEQIAEEEIVQEEVIEEEEAEIECEADDDCEDYLLCVNNKCIEIKDGCEDDDDCEGDLICVDGFCEEEDGEEGGFGTMGYGTQSEDTFTDDDESDFNQGTYSNTEWGINHVELSSGQSSGTFESRIFNAGSSSEWNNISWTSNAIGELPDNKEVETKFTDGNANMTGNVLLMHLNEASGTIADTSGEGNNCTQIGGVTYNSSGKLNTALRFDGSNDYLSCGNDASLNLRYTLTIEAWVKPDTLSAVNQNSIVDHPNSYWFYISTSSKLGFLRFKGTYDAVGTDETIPTGTWTHIAVTYNNSATNEVNLYINGQLKKTASLDGPMDSSTNNLIIADRGNLHYFDGTIDEIAIYNRSLSAEEILDNYKRGALRLNLTVRSCDDDSCSGEDWQGAYGEYDLPDNKAVEVNSNGANMTGNILLMHLDEASGTIVDNSGEGNNGTALGNPIYSASGKFNTALNFSGADQYINTSVNDDSWAGTSFTISAWVFLDSINPGNNAIIVGRHKSSSEKNFQVGMETDNRLLFSTYANCGADSTTLYSTETLTTNTWYHLTYVLSHNNWKKIYLNGVEVANSTSTASIASGCAQTTTIGSNYRAPSTTSWVGLIDEVAIYNRTLSATEIYNHYMKGAGNYFTESPQDISAANNQYFQYKFAFETDNSSYSPELYSVSVDYPNTAAPGIILNSPANGSSSNETFRLLNATATDENNNLVDVTFYGSHNSSFDEIFELNTTTNVANGTDAVFNWTETIDELSVDDDMVLLMHMNEASGTIVDSSGQGNNGTAGGGITYSEDGKFNTALGFNGNNTYVDTNYDDSYNFSRTGEFTVAAWIKPAAGLTDGDIATHYYSTTNNRVWALQIRNNVSRFVACSNGTSASCKYSTGTTLVTDANKWYYLVGRWNSTNIDIYLNGAAEDSGADSLTALHSMSERGVRIGRQAAIEWFNGTIDEVAIWNRSLSLSEIQELYELKAGTYYWYANATDGENTTQSDTWQFTVESEPPASVTNLAEQSAGSTWIYWNWTNPSDYDFNSAIVYVDGEWKINTSNNYYNATGLNAHINYTITVHTKDDYGYLNDTDVNDSAETLNTAPEASNVNISPGSPTSIDDLTCNYTFYDADGDNESGTTFAWYKNNVSQANLTTQTIDSSNIMGLEEWKCEVTPGDGIDYGASVNSSAATIQNGAPSAVNLTLISTDSGNRTNGTLQANYTFYDADTGDTEQDNQIKWYKDDAEQSGLENSTTVNSNYTSKDEEWKFSARVNDGVVWGDWTNSSVLTIQNSLPTAPVVDVLPNIPEDDGDLAASITTSSSDADNDSITYSYQWYKNNILQAGQTSNSLSNLLTSSEEIWKCEVTPNDGVGDGAVGEDSVTINGTAEETYVINLISPANAGAWDSSNDVLFEYNVTTDFENCSLIVDGEIKQNDTNITANTTESFVQTLSDDDYVWSVNCTDAGNNTNSSANWQLTVDYHYCGDSVCDDDESCSSCSSDCGRCSSGGGGSRGGSYAPPKINITNITECAESWSCSAWYECVNGVQARNCVDSNNCGTIKYKPIETQSCIAGEQDIIEKPRIIETEYEFSLEQGQSYEFEFNREIHKLVLEEILRDNLIKLTLYSEPKTFALSNLEIREFDLDKDGIKDVKISFEKTDGLKADIKIVLLNKGLGGISGQAVTGKEIIVNPEQGPDPYYMVPALLLIIIFITVLSLRKAKLSKKMRKFITLFHVSLVVLIAVLFLTSFLTSSGLTGLTIANKQLLSGTEQATVNSAVDLIKIPLFIIVSIAIALSLIIVYIHHKRNLKPVKHKKKIKKIIKKSDKRRKNIFSMFMHNKKPGKKIKIPKSPKKMKFEKKKQINKKDNFNKREIVNQLKKAYKL